MTLLYLNAGAIDMVFRERKFRTSTNWQRITGHPPFGSSPPQSRKPDSGKRGNPIMDIHLFIRWVDVHYWSNGWMSISAVLWVNEWMSRNGVNTWMSRIFHELPGTGENKSFWM